MDAFILESLKTFALSVNDNESPPWELQKEMWNAWYTRAIKGKGTELVGLKANELRALRKQSQSSLESTPGLSMPAIFVPGSRPSHSSLESLTPIKLGEMKFEVQAKGSYLVLRLISEPHKYPYGSIAAIEDGDGTVQRMFLLDYEPHFSIHEGLHEGVAVAIKEPTYGICADHKNGLRIDHPSDLLVLDSQSELIPATWRCLQAEPSKSVEEWAEEGSRAQKQTLLNEAIKCYTAALASSDALDSATRKRLLTSRAEVYEESGKYEAAHTDVQKILAETAVDKHAFHIGAKALYRLGRWQDCYEQLKTWCDKYKDDNEAKSLLLRAEERMKESSTGEFDFSHTMTTLKRSPGQLSVDHASFTKCVRIGSSSTHGRGLFATEAISPGDLVLCEKAFVVANGVGYTGFDGPFVMPKEKNAPILSRDQYWYNLQTSRPIYNVLSILLPHVVKTLTLHPSKAEQFYDICAGSVKRTGSEGVLVDGRPVIDCYLAEAIIEMNCFTPTDPAFQLAYTAEEPSHVEKSEMGLKSETYGLWLLSSYINHSCLSNSSPSFIGDMLVLRAVRHIASGEEITIHYCPIENSVKFRHQELQRNWDFTCQCKLCQADLALSPKLRDSRTILLRQLDGLGFAHVMGDSSINDLTDSQLENYIAELEKTYPINLYRNLPKIELAQAYFQMVGICRTQRRHSVAMTWMKRVFEALRIGLCLDLECLWAEVIFRPDCGHSPNAVDVLMYMADMWMCCSLPVPKERVVQLLKAQARLIYRIVTGEDSTFDERFRHLRSGNVPSTMDGFVKPKDWETRKKKCRRF